MGSRRRGRKAITEDELQRGQPITSSTNYDSSLQLLPGVKRGNNSADDYIGHHKWQSKRAPVIHPALTDFGPESLQKFLRDELVKLQNHIQDAQEQQRRAYALYLVNATGNVYSFTENGQRGFRISGSRALQPTPRGANTRSLKGKQPLRTRTPLARTRSVSTVSADNAVVDVEADNPVHQTYDTAHTPKKTDQDAPTHKSRTSFENHTSSTRVSQRTRNKSFSQSVHSINELTRRRKTPAVSSLFDSHSASSSSPHNQTSARRRHEQASDLSSDLPTDADCVPSISSTGPSCLLGRLKDDLSIQSLNSLEDDLQEQEAILASIQDHGLPREAYYDYRRIVPEEMPVNTVQAEFNRARIWQACGLDARGRPLVNNDHLLQSSPFTLRELDPRRQNFLNAPDENGDYPRKLPQHFSNLPKPADMPRPPKESQTTLPFEIWEAGVLQHLSSCEVRNLRLVCKALASDLEPYVFRNVVTKFGPSLFSLNPHFNEEGDLDLPASSHKTMRDSYEKNQDIKSKPLMCPQPAVKVNGLENKVHSNPDRTYSMMEKYGPEMNKFGISMECDMQGLSHAPYKTTEATVDAWFGRYRWPVKDYPYFESLKELDRLLDDDRRLLTQSMKYLRRCSELAISVDSGHGWLEGPDISDLALYKQRAYGGDKVFGKTFSAPDKSHDDGMKDLFRWAQINTVNENIKYLKDCGKSQDSKELALLRAIAIRDYDSFVDATIQPDHDRHLHTGGLATFPTQEQPDPTLNNTPYGLNGLPGSQSHLQLFNNLPSQSFLSNLNHRRRHLFTSATDIVSRNSASPGLLGKPRKPRRNRRQVQWPILFSGFNLAAEPRGDADCVQSRVAPPPNFSLIPSSLTEAQAQWIMETSWIQRTFLSTYTDAVRVNSSVFKSVHSLHIAKISSGLLPALSQKSFWTSLPTLGKVTILVKPDWRVEHIPGDKYYQSTMVTNPVNAVDKFFDLLSDVVAPIESLNSLHIGYSGGGEQQPGMFGRNQHVLPAPITSRSRAWLAAQNPSNTMPSLSTVLVFPHVRTLTFENCWFSPLLLEKFMHKSRDTSLHNLTLDSVSITAQVTSTRTDGPLRTVEDHLKCRHPASAWLHEIIPANASWVTIIEHITPGHTILDRKYDADMIDTEQNPRPERKFRGNIQRIKLKSCGYVKIVGIPSNEFNQNELVCQSSSWMSMDEGLRARACMFNKNVTLTGVHLPDHKRSGQDVDASVASFRANRTGPQLLSHVQPQTQTSLAMAASGAEGLLPFPVDQKVRDMMEKQLECGRVRHIMLAGRHGHARGESFASDTHVHPTAMTGVLTQCIHPIEKRILECMWGLKFGWGNDMSRWDAVEDGWYVGGTGRFSGDIYKDSALQDIANANSSMEIHSEIRDPQNEQSTTRDDSNDDTASDYLTGIWRGSQGQEHTMPDQNGLGEDDDQHDEMINDFESDDMHYDIAQVPLQLANNESMSPWNQHDGTIGFDGEVDEFSSSQSTSSQALDDENRRRVFLARMGEILPIVNNFPGRP